MILLNTIRVSAIIGCLIVMPVVGWTQMGQPRPPADDQTVPLPTDPAAVIAVVGQSRILWGDIQPKVDAKIASVLKNLKQKFPDSELAVARKQLSRTALIQAIQNKMMSEAFLLDQVGTEAADKRREVSDMMMNRARQVFFEQELKGLKKRFGTEDLTELDQKLREAGTSLYARQREFIDMMLAHMYMSSKVNKDPQVSLAEINSEYTRTLDTYREGAKARWEQLSALFENHPSREATEAAIKAMGNEAYYGRMDIVAKKKSEEPFASDGGQHDWTTQGSLVSKPIDEAIFSIPLNKMSEIIPDDQGMHIVRVIERKAAGVRPLADVQDEIREAIKKKKVVESQKKMLEDLRERVPVWSIYPDDVPGAKPLRVINQASTSKFGTKR